MLKVGRSMILGLAVVGAGVVMTRVGDLSRIALPVRGVDVSHHQGRIDWEALSDSGIAFAFMKASEGRDHRDRRFRENWADGRCCVIPLVRTEMIRNRACENARMPFGTESATGPPTIGHSWPGAG